MTEEKIIQLYNSLPHEIEGVIKESAYYFIDQLKTHFVRLVVELDNKKSIKIEINPISNTLYSPERIKIKKGANYPDLNVEAMDYEAYIRRGVNQRITHKGKLIL